MGRNTKRKAAPATGTATEESTTPAGPTKKIAKKSNTQSPSAKKIKLTKQTTTDDAPATSPAAEAVNSPSTSSTTPSSSSTPSSSITTTTSPAPAPVRKPSAKLAARRAKVLSYEAQLAPQPNPVKGVQKGAAPTKSEGELKRVEQLAAHLRTLQEDEAAREKLRRQQEEAAKRLALTSVKHLRGAAKTAFDVWEGHPHTTAKKMMLEEKKVQEEWVDPTLPKPVKAPKGLLERQHPTAVPAVELPAPGISYRPAYEDHQDVLGEVLAKQLKRQEEKRKLNRVVRPIQKGLQRKHNSIHEYTAGLEDILGIKKAKVHGSEQAEQETAAAAAAAAAEEEAVSLPRKRPIASSRWSIKTSKTERNKLKKRENRRKTKKYKRLLKKRKAELEAIPEIVQEITEQEAEQQTYLEHKRVEKADKEGRTKQLSRYAFAHQPTPYLLTDELPQTLRQFKPLPDYNPLKERFISLQKRNLIEARVRVAAKRRYRVKSYVPKSAKRDWDFIDATSKFDDNDNDNDQ